MVKINPDNFFPDAAVMPLSLAEFIEDATEQMPRVGDVFGSEKDLRESLAVDGTASPATRNAQIVRTVCLPNTYIAGGDITLSVVSALTETINTSAFIDATVFKKAAAGTKSGGDLNQTDQQDINRTGHLTDEFTIDGSGLNPGDELLIAIKISLNDTGSASAGDKKAELTSAFLTMTTRGGLIA